MATKATDIDLTLFQIGRLEDSSTVSSQKIAWINYETNKKKLHIQTPVFVTETYGIPERAPTTRPTSREPSTSWPSAMNGQSTVTRSTTLPWSSSTRSWWR